MEPLCTESLPPIHHAAASSSPPSEAHAGRETGVAISGLSNSPGTTRDFVILFTFKQILGTFHTSLDSTNRNFNVVQSMLFTLLYVLKQHV